MPHLLVGGSNRPGLAAIEAASAMGHAVTFLTTPGMNEFFRDGGARRILQGARVVETDGFKSVDALTELVQAIHLKHPVDAALTVFEPVVRPFAEACHRLGLKATSLASIEAARDKARCREILREKGISQVPSCRVTRVEEAFEFAARVGFPIVLKPNNGLGSMLVRRVDSAAEIEQYFQHIPSTRKKLPAVVNENIDLGHHIVAEQYIVGVLHSVELGMTVDGPRFFALSRRKRDASNDALEIGSTIPATPDARVTQRAYAYAGTVISALGFDRGIFHVEIIIDAYDVPHLVEVNPRLMGGTLPSLYGLIAKRDIFEDLIRIHLDEPIAPPPRLHGAVASRVIGAMEEWTVRSDLPADWIRPLEYALAFHSIDIRAVQQLPKMRNNLTALGQFQVEADTPWEADAKADELVNSVSRITGIPLCR